MKAEIRKNDLKKIEKVPVKIWTEFKTYGYRFGVHHSIETGCKKLWNVSELSTGAAAVYNCKTQKEAVAEAKKRLKKVGKKDTILAIEYIKNFGNS